MNGNPHRLIGFGLAVIAFASGCTGQWVRPSAESILTPKAPAPIPVAIGILDVDQKLAGGFSDLAPGFKRQLNESGLFQTVYYPTRPTDPLDGTISLRVNTSFKDDPWTFPKGFLTGATYFAAEPLVIYKHKYQAQCSLDLMKGERYLKSYTAEGIVVASHKLLFHRDQLDAAGTEAAGKLLWANLIEQLCNDRAFLEQELVPRPAPAQWPVYVPQPQ